MNDETEEKTVDQYSSQREFLRSSAPALSTMSVLSLCRLAAAETRGRPLSMAGYKYDRVKALRVERQI